MMKNSIMILTVFAVLTGTAGAQNVNNLKVVRHYTLAEGLLDSTTTAIGQDPLTGEIWVGTTRGFGKFEGDVFKAIFKGGEESKRVQKIDFTDNYVLVMDETALHLYHRTSKTWRSRGYYFEIWQKYSPNSLNLANGYSFLIDKEDSLIIFDYIITP